LDETRALLYIANTGNSPIQLIYLNISTVGRTIAQFEGVGTRLNQLNNPYDVKVARKIDALCIADI